jgi:hypothetical protein
MNSATKAFEDYASENIPAAVSANSFTRNEDGSYKNVILCGHYEVWEAACADFQARLDERHHHKDLNRPAKFKEGCDCGCNAPSFTTPFGALRFLMHRMNSAGVGDAVGESYAHDIAQILNQYDAMESDAHLSVVHK